MNLAQLLVLLLIAAVCGAIGQAIAGVSRGGLLVSIALGFVGAYLGSWLATSLDLPEPMLVSVGDSDFPILWSVVGSALFVAIVSALGRGGRKR